MMRNLVNGNKKLNKKMRTLKSFQWVLVKTINSIAMNVSTHSKANTNMIDTLKSIKTTISS